jgi:hypothetical protein
MEGDSINEAVQVGLNLQLTRLSSHNLDRPRYIPSSTNIYVFRLNM